MIKLMEMHKTEMIEMEADFKKLVTELKKANQGLELKCAE
eukprot:CAMPEP_0116928238 /NCGR_PEP_ID=MMETSP0467-20121206/25862_1 /TAXON_ID=283647 /ORGANISM="Mesodinium pulex, Strain SPMC105" /LENGTH=39 /DNA_ID= /DNA_START= /DNA_END= /DNA_ORIENTATION=